MFHHEATKPTKRFLKSDHNSLDCNFFKTKPIAYRPEKRRMVQAPLRVFVTSW